MSRYLTDIKPSMEKFYMNFTNSHGNGVSLAGDSLIYFIRNMSLFGLENIKTAVTKNVMAIRPRDSERCKISIPVPIGKTLDSITPQWDEWPQFANVPGGRNGIKYIPKTVNGIYMTKERRENAHELVSGMLAAGKKVGIADKMFLGFGGLLGHALIGDFLWNDDDVDMCILADKIPQEQRREYLMELRASGMTEKRLHGPRLFEDKYVWFSIGNKSKKFDCGTKACNWFWFKHGGYYWHAKGIGWRPGFAAKGIPLSEFDGTLKEVQFGPNKIQVPHRVGACLDWWYGGDWVEERGGSSRESALLQVENEGNRSMWKIVRK